MSGPSLWSTVKLDVTIQARSKLYAAGIGVAVVMGCIARFLIGPEHADLGVPILYLLGLGGTTYVFGASMILMEKSQGTLAALRVTPLSTKTYLASKMITLVTFAAVEGAIVQVIGFGGAIGHLLPLAAGVVALGLMCTLIGFGQVASYNSVLAFLMPGAALVGSIMQWPALGPLDIGPSWLWYAVPTNAPFFLMLGAFQPLTDLQWAYAIVVSAGTIAVSYAWAKQRFRTHIRLQEG